jgi:hypothetical protein
MATSRVRRRVSPKTAKRPVSHLAFHRALRFGLANGVGNLPSLLRKEEITWPRKIN